jgi:hypothetical protein
MNPRCGPTCCQLCFIDLVDSNFKILAIKSDFQMAKRGQRPGLGWVRNSRKPGDISTSFYCNGIYLQLVGGMLLGGIKIGAYCPNVGGLPRRSRSIQHFKAPFPTLGNALRV